MFGQVLHLFGLSAIIDTATKNIHLRADFDEEWKFLWN